MQRMNPLRISIRFVTELYQRALQLAVDQHVHVTAVETSLPISYRELQLNAESIVLAHTSTRHLSYQMTLTKKLRHMKAAVFGQRESAKIQPRTRARVCPRPGVTDAICGSFY
jgi:hypothetical protein